MAPRKPKPEVEEVPVITEDVTFDAPEVEAPTSGKGVAVVAYSGGLREFSKEVHGADYKALAAEFATKHNGKVA